MSETVVAFAALFAIGMMGLGLAVLVKGAREEPEVRDPSPDWTRPPGLG